MINGGYLIPANTKKGQLIFGAFTLPDLCILGVGVFFSLIFLLILGADDTVGALLSVSPGLFCGFLVMPIPNYRNVITFFNSMIHFYSGQRIYKWKGWCLYEQERQRK